MRARILQAVVVAFAAAYGLFARDLAASAGVMPGIWDIVLGVALSPLFVAYVVVPAWIVATVLTNQRVVAPERLLRLGSRRRAWAAALGDAARRYAGTSALVIVALLVISVGLDPGVRSPLEPAAAVFARLGILPLAALALQAVILGIALLSVTAVLAALRATLDRPVHEVIAGVAVFAWAAVSTTGAFGPGSIADAGYISNAANVVDRPEVASRALLILLLVIGVAALAVFVRDRRDQDGSVGFVRPSTVAGAAGIALLVFTVVAARPAGAEFVDLTTQALFGSGATLVQYLPPTLIAVGYAVMLVLRLPAPRSPIAAARMLRHGSPLRWAACTFVRELPVALAIAVAIPAVCAVAFVLAGGNDFAEPEDVLDPWLVQFGVNGALQSIAYAALVVILNLARVGRLAQLVSMIALVPIGLLVGPDVPWLPIGSAALGRSVAGWVSVAAVSGGLIATIVGLILAGLLLGLRRKWSW